MPHYTHNFITQEQKTFGRSLLKWSDLSVPDMESPGSRKGIAIVASVVASHAITVTTQGCRDRIPIFLKRISIMKTCKMTNRKMRINLKSKILKPLSRITTARTRTYGFLTSGGSTASQPGPLTPVAPKGTCALILILRPKGNESLWYMSVLTWVLQILKMVLLIFLKPKERLPWLDFMVTSSINPSKLDLPQLPLICQFLLLLIIWTRPHYSPVVPNHCSKHHRPLILVYPSMMLTSVVVKKLRPWW